MANAERIAACVTPRLGALGPASLAALIVLLVSCAHGPRKMYAGPERPAAEIAVVWSAIPGRNAPTLDPDVVVFDMGRLLIVEVDGQPTEDWNEAAAYAVHVLPGRHRFRLKYSVPREVSPGRLSISRGGTGEITAELVAGRSYLVTALVDEERRTLRFELRPYPSDATRI